MKYVTIFVFSFLVVYLFYFFFVIRRKKGIEAFKNGKQVLFFERAYKLDLKKLDYKKFARSLYLVNSFIVAFTVTVIELVDGYMLKLLVGFVILIPLILGCYYVLGKYYKKKEGK